MRHAVALFLLSTTTWAALLASAGQPTMEPGPEEAILRAAGLDTETDALLDFFRERTQPRAELDKLLALARQLGDANAQTRANAAAKLVATGAWAGPALRHVVNELDNPQAAQHARRCLEWIEGPHSRDVPIAAAMLLAARKPAAAAATLLAFLPVADDQAVVDAVKAALASIAAQPGKTDAALLAALQDPLPLRRAIAVEVLAGNGNPDLLPDVRKLLTDPMAQVRLRAALALTRRSDETAVGVLIDLLAELPASERLQAEKALQQLAGDWSPGPALQGDDALSRKVRREVWAGWWRTMDGPALLAALRQRAVKTKGDKEKLPSSLPGLLAVRKPAGATEALLAFLPFADERAMQEGIGKALKILVMANGQPDPIVIKALSDPLPVRRIAAATALAGAGGAANAAVRKLLTDGDPEVRLRVALALVLAYDKEAVPALIDLVGELPRDQAAEAEDLLRRLAGAKSPAIPLGENPASRGQLHAAWQDWWKDHGATVDMAVLEKISSLFGVTVVAEVGSRNQGIKGGIKAGPVGAGGFGGGLPAPPPPLAPPVPGNPLAGTDRLVAVDRNGQTQWQIENLDCPVDFQILPGGRVLIAEYNGKRVTERDFKGKILWEKTLPGSPVNVQRLANGNTFVVLNPDGVNASLLVEVEPTGTIKAVNLPGGGAAVIGPGGGGPAPFIPNIGVMAGYKMADGRMVCLLVDGTCLRLNETGQETRRFVLPRANTVAGNIDVTANGHVILVQSDNTVEEYDTDGKTVWQGKTAGIGRATRLANGNTLVALIAGSVAELDNAGRTVWQYQSPAAYQALRARPLGESKAAVQPVVVVRAETPFRPVPPADPVAVAKKPSAADALKREDIPAATLARLGTGNGDAPKELVAVLGKIGDPQIVSLALSADGRTLVAGGVSETKAQLFDLASGKLLKTLSATAAKGNLVAISNDAAMVAMSGDRPTVQVVDTGTGQLRTTINSSTLNRNVLDVVFSHDGKFVGLGDNVGNVVIRDLQSGKDRTLAGHLNSVTKLLFSPDGKFLVTAGGNAPNREVIIWELATGWIVGRVQGHTNSVFGLAWHPHGKTLATGSLDGTIRLWNLETMKETQLLRGNGAEVHSLAWHPSGDFLASNEHSAGTVTLWDMRATPPRPRVIRLFPADAAAKASSRFNNDVLFTPEGRHLIAANSDGTVSVLRLAELGQLLK